MKIYILAYDTKTLDVAKSIEKRYSWASAFLMPDMTPELPLFESLFYYKMLYSDDDYIGTLSYKCEQKGLNLDKIDAFIQKEKHLDYDMVHLYAFQGYFGSNKEHPHFQDLWKRHLEPGAGPTATANRSYCNYWFAKRDVMHQYCKHIQGLVPKMLQDPVSKSNAMYPGAMSRESLIKTTGSPWYPHLPFMIERYCLPYFIFNKFKVLALNTKMDIVFSSLVFKSDFKNVDSETQLLQLVTASKNPCWSFLRPMASADTSIKLYIDHKQVLNVPEIVFSTCINEALSRKQEWDFVALGPQFTEKNVTSDCTFSKKTLNFFTIYGQNAFKISNAYLVSESGSKAIRAEVPIDTLVSRYSSGKWTWQRPIVWYPRVSLTTETGLINQKWFNLQLADCWKKAIPSCSKEVPSDINLKLI